MRDISILLIYCRLLFSFPTVKSGRSVFASINAYFAFLAGSVTVDQSVVALALLVIIGISLKNFIERVRITDESCGKAVKS